MRSKKLSALIKKLKKLLSMKHKNSRLERLKKAVLLKNRLASSKRGRRWSVKLSSSRLRRRPSRTD